MIEGMPMLGLVDPVLAQAAVAFFAPESGNGVPQGEKQLAQHLERVQVNRELRNRVRGGLAAALG